MQAGQANSYVYGSRTSLQSSEFYVDHVWKTKTKLKPYWDSHTYSKCQNHTFINFKVAECFEQLTLFGKSVFFVKSLTSRFPEKKYQLAEKYRNPNFALSSKHTNYVKQKTTVKMIKYCQLENRICLLYEKTVIKPFVRYIALTNHVNMSSSEFDFASK